MSKELLETINSMIERIAIIELHTGESKSVLIDKHTLLDIQKELELQSINNSNSSKALECLERFFNSRKIYEPNNTVIFDCIICLNSIKQYILKAQEQEKKNARLKEILINGFTDKKGIFHKQTYLAFIDGEWCVCDLETDVWFLVKEVLM